MSRKVSGKHPVSQSGGLPPSLALRHGYSAPRYRTKSTGGWKSPNQCPLYPRRPPHSMGSSNSSDGPHKAAVLESRRRRLVCSQLRIKTQEKPTLLQVAGGAHLLWAQAPGGSSQASLPSCPDLIRPLYFAMHALDKMMRGSGPAHDDRGRQVGRYRVLWISAVAAMTAGRLAERPLTSPPASAP